MVSQNRPYTTILWLWLTTLSITDPGDISVDKILDPGLEIV